MEIIDLEGHQYGRLS